MFACIQCVTPDKMSAPVTWELEVSHAIPLLLDLERREHLAQLLNIVLGTCRSRCMRTIQQIRLGHQPWTSPLWRLTPEPRQARCIHPIATPSPGSFPTKSVLEKGPLAMVCKVLHGCVEPAVPDQRFRVRLCGNFCAGAVLSKEFQLPDGFGLPGVSSNSL